MSVGMLSAICLICLGIAMASLTATMYLRSGEKGAVNVRECVGWWGRVFGHRFKRMQFDIEQLTGAVAQLGETMEKMEQILHAPDQNSG